MEFFYIEKVKMGLQCTECSIQLSDRRSLKKHTKRKHNIFPDMLTFSCSQCSANENSLLLLRKHSITNHQKPVVKICYSCRIGFQSKTDYANHVNNEHGLPIYDMAPEDINPVKPTVTSINGSINYYEITPESTSLDIMEYLFAKRKEISDIVRKHTNQYPQKMQLTVELSLTKPVAEETERVTVYFNTETVSLYHTGLSDETYTELVDSIVTKLVSFSSHGSGW